MSFEGSLRGASGAFDADIAIAGGGPAGLSLAIRAARAGFRTLLFERAAEIPDKACGEGLMPRGVRALEELGVLRAIPENARMPFAGIRYALEDGRAFDARFRRGNGLGIRRTALSLALREAALGAGARIERATVRGFRATDRGVTVETDRGPIDAALLVGADGLQSPLRRAAGLDGALDRTTTRATRTTVRATRTATRAALVATRAAAGAMEPSRYGVRRHYLCAPWSDLVEVHWNDGAECYVTPVGPGLVNIAFLWEPALGSSTAGGSSSGGEDRFAALLARFPKVAAHLEGAEHASEARGAGPLLRKSRGRAAERIALIGDAAGYVDAVTGQGLSLAFTGAEALVAALPRTLDDRAVLEQALHRYDRSLRKAWLKYAIPARALLALTRHPKLRRAALGLVARTPRFFALLVEAIAAA